MSLPLVLRSETSSSFAVLLTPSPFLLRQVRHFILVISILIIFVRIVILRATISVGGAHHQGIKWVLLMVNGVAVFVLRVFLSILIRTGASVSSVSPLPSLSREFISLVIISLRVLLFSLLLLLLLLLFFALVVVLLFSHTTTVIVGACRFIMGIQLLALGTNPQCIVLYYFVLVIVSVNVAVIHQGLLLTLFLIFLIYFISLARNHRGVADTASKLVPIRMPASRVEQVLALGSDANRALRCGCLSAATAFFGLTPTRAVGNVTSTRARASLVCGVSTRVSSPVLWVRTLVITVGTCSTVHTAETERNDLVSVGDGRATNFSESNSAAWAAVVAGLIGAAKTVRVETVTACESFVSLLEDDFVQAADTVKALAAMLSHARPENEAHVAFLTIVHPEFGEFGEHFGWNASEIRLGFMIGRHVSVPDAFCSETTRACRNWAVMDPLG
jgi:hypothetical protein